MNGHTDAAVPLLVGGADQSIKTNDGLLLSWFAVLAKK
jgi:hypothetical protein